MSIKALGTSHYVLVILSISLLLSFQNCSGWIVGNPITTISRKLAFAPYKTELKNADVCLSNIVFEMSSIVSDFDLKDQILTIPYDGVSQKFDIAYFYYDPVSTHYFYSGLMFDHPLKLNSSGTDIGDFLLPDAKYERITFGFSKCNYSGGRSISITNTHTSTADKPDGFFALNYEAKNIDKNFDDAFVNGFQIEYLTNQLAQVDEATLTLDSVLEQYRNFDLVGFSSTSLDNHVSHRLEELVELPGGNFIAGGYAAKLVPSIYYADGFRRFGGWVMLQFNKFGQLLNTNIEYNDLAPNKDVFLDGYYDRAGGIYGLVVSTNGTVFAAGLASPNEEDPRVNFDYGVKRLFAPLTAPPFADQNWAMHDQSKSNTNTIDYAYDITNDSAGNLYVVGATKPNIDSNYNKIVVEKLDASGTRVWGTDETFESAPWDLSFNAMAIVAHKNQVIAIAASRDNWRLDRYLSNSGALDTSFATQGKLFLNFNNLKPPGQIRSTSPIPADILVQENIFCSITNTTEDKILAIGKVYLGSDKAYPRLVIARLNWDGSYDPCFGNGKASGVFILDMGPDMISYGKGISLADNGQIIVSGVVENQNKISGVDNSLLVMALTADGKPILNSANKPNMRFFTTSAALNGGDILIRKSDGHIVVSGSFGDTGLTSKQGYHVIVLSP